MSVRGILLILFAGAALLLGAGCGGRGDSGVADESTDPWFQKAQRLKLQGRSGEAFLAFEKVIERRGEIGAPESHLEAGILSLKHLKDPITAHYHFGRYLALNPASERSKMVMEQRDAAVREAARIFLVPHGYSAGTTDTDEVNRLRSRIDELQAEIRMLQGTSGMPVIPATAPTISFAQPQADPAGQPPVIPLSSAPPETDEPSSAPPRGFSLSVASAQTAQIQPQPGPAQVQSQPAAGPTPAIQPRVPPPQRPGQQQAAPVAGRSVPQRPTQPAATASGRRHTVVQGQGLLGIARQYYGPKATMAQARAIYQANTDVMSNDGDLRPGMTLRIP